MARYWGQQKEEALTTVGGGSENLQGVSASDRKRWDGKQDQLAYDNKPMRGSVNVLNSDAIARAFEEFKDAISTAYKQYLNTQVTSYAEMVTAVTNAKNDVDNAYAAIEKYETNMRALYEDTLSKLTDAQNILAGATTLLNKTNTESSALSAKIKQLESVHSSIISDLGVLRNALAEVSNDADGAQLRIEELISKANEVDVHVADLVKTVEDALAEIETEKEDTLTKIRAVRASIPDDYEKVCKDVNEIRQELADARRRGTWITSQTAAGEIVRATGCAPASPLSIKLFGKTAQPTTSGKNLWSGGDVSGTKNTSVTSIETIPAGTYTISANITSEDTDNNVCLIHFYYVNGGGFGVYLQHGARKSDLLKFANDVGAYIAYASNSAANAEGDTFSFTDIQIEPGSTATDYEPYTGGEASPNMNYPQPANPLGKNGSIAGKVLAINLWDKEWAYRNWTLRTGSVANGGYRDVAIRVGKGNDVTISYGKDLPTGLELYCGVCLTFEEAIQEKNWLYHSAGTLGKKAVTVTSIEDYIYIRYYGTVDNFTQYIGNDLQIEYGTVATPLKAYTEQPFTVLTPNGLKGIPLGTTIPNAIKNSPIHMSGVYWDNADGKYYISDTKDYESGKSVQRIVEYVVDGNAEWYSYPTYNGFALRLLSFKSLYRNGFCNQTTINTNGSIKQGEPQLIIGQDNVAIYLIFNQFYDEALADKGLSNLKAHLNENPLVITTWLDEPIVTDLTEEEMAQYNALHMNYPNTTIVNDANAYTEVEYGKDAEAYIDENYTPKSEHEALAQRVKVIEEEIIKL